MIAIDSLQFGVSNRDRAFLKLAQKCAQASGCTHQHGAVMVKGGSVIAIGINKWKNHPNVLGADNIENNCSTHAEMDALSRVSSAKNTTVYVARISKHGLPKLSRPCDVCYANLRKAGVHRIVYTI